MRKIFVDKDGAVREAEAGRLLSCYRRDGESCSNFCAAFQHEDATQNAPAHVSCGLMRDNAWIGELEPREPEQPLVVKCPRCGAIPDFKFYCVECHKSFHIAEEST